MPLDDYREQVDGGPATSASPAVPANDDNEPWLDPDSSWDATRERPLPDFDWGD